MIMVHLQIICLLLLLGTLVAQAPPRSPTNVLVIGSAETKSTHARFLSTLTKLNKKVSYHSSTAPIKLVVDGTYKYDAVILLAPDKDLSKTLSISSLSKFLDDGNWMFVVAGSKVSSYTEKAAELMGVDVDRTAVVDHQNPHQLDDGSHSTINACSLHKSRFLFGEHSESCIVFRGPSATLFKDNQLVDGIIVGSPSTYASSQTMLTTIPRSAGSATVLAAALSTRRGGRAVYFGSFQMLSDEMFDKVGTAHEGVLTSLLEWSLGVRGVLRVGTPRHWTEAGVGAYRVRDMLDYEIDVLSWDGLDKTWKPFRADDMQIEFNMLDPWVRTRLTDNRNGTFSAKIRVPDQRGVFKFSLKYFRAGVSPLDVETVVPVRPYLHNEYERFIGMAVPYYVSSFLMLLGPLLVVMMVMFGGTEGKMD